MQGASCGGIYGFGRFLVRSFLGWMDRDMINNDFIWKQIDGFDYVITVSGDHVVHTRRQNKQQ